MSGGGFGPGGDDSAPVAGLDEKQKGGTREVLRTGERRGKKGAMVMGGVLYNGATEEGGGGGDLGGPD
jgi:hypothetical protein